MPEQLSPEQQQTAQQLDARIGAIVATGSLAALRATGVLGAAPAGGQVEADFHRRLQQIGPRLAGLGNRVVVNAALLSSMAANTSIDSGPPPVVKYLELRPDLLRSSPRLLTSNALTIGHELAHSLDENGVFPVRDYAYRKGWSWGYLTPELTAVNADSYAEALALLAEAMEHRPHRYQEFGRVPAQCAYLRAVGNQTVLGSALAWVELVVNRAWIRSLDAWGMAGESFEDAKWPAKLAAWQADPNTAALQNVENKLVKHDFIGARYSPFGKTGLSTYAQWTVGRIHEFMAELKGALSGLEPVPVLNGQQVVYDRAAKLLTVPLSQSGLGPVQLGEQILVALLAALAPSGFNAPKFAPQLRRIITWLVDYDRPQEHAALQPLLAQLSAAPAQQSTAVQWAGVAEGLKRAALRDIAAQWTMLGVMAVDVAAMAAGERAVLEHIDESLAASVTRAERIGRQLLDVKADVKPEFRDLQVALFEIATPVVKLFADRNAQYTALRTRLEAFA